MAQILDMVCDEVNDYLLQIMQTNLTAADPTKAVLVRIGRLQDDPSVNFIYALTQSGDPEDPDGWAHNMAGYTEAGQPTLEFGNPPYIEIGGREAFWWRRMTVQLGCYFVTQGYDRETSRELAHRVLGRAELGVQQCPGLLGLEDEFGERIVAVYVAKSHFTESGGPPDKFIWRGKISFCLLTTR